jgi:hypothetical protein
VVRLWVCPWFDAREIAVTIVEQNRDGIPAPDGRQHQVERVIAIDVTHLDEQTSLGSNQTEGCGLYRGEPELHPVVIRRRRIRLAGLNSGQVWALIAVEVGDGEWHARSSGTKRGLLKF